jgi:hypothetical protein
MKRENIALGLEADGATVQSGDTWISYYGHPTLGNGTIDLRNGSVNSDQSTDNKTMQAALARAHSRGVLATQAKRYGWQVKATGQNKFQVIKR